MVDTSARISAIQGLRAVAIIAVVAYHLGLPIGAGFIGVDVFFVISGFVITRMVLRSTAASGRLDLKAFWAGRIRRLLPALTVMVVLTAVCASVLASPVRTQTETALTGAAASVWVSNGLLAVLLSGYFAGAAAGNPLLHTWSLAVEEQFYVVFPLLVAAVLWWTRRRGGSSSGRLARWITVVAVGSFGLCVILTFVPLPLPVGPLLAFYSPFTRVWEFAAGVLLAIAIQRGWSPGRWSRWSLALGAGLLVVGLAVIAGGQRFPGWIAVVPVAATVLLLIGSLVDAPGVRVLTNRPMTYLGDISYSWYLFHWPVIVLASANVDGDLSVAMTIAVLLVGLALAAASHRWLEQPIRERRVLARLRAPVLAVAVIVPAIVVSAGLQAGAQRGWGQDAVRDMQAQLDHSQWQYQATCQAPVTLDKRDMTDCRVEADPANPAARPLILVGDSNAGVYAELMVEVAADLDRTVTIATVPSCALADVEVIAADGSSWLDCREFYRTSMAWLAEQPPSTVVVASGAASIDLDTYALRLPDGRVAATGSEKQRAWQEAMEGTFADLKARGHAVVHVELVPHFLTWSPAQCTLVEMLRDGVSECGATRSRAKADELQAGTLAAEEAAVTAAGVDQIALRDALCPDDRCRTNDGATWYYEDGAHLSFAGALSLSPEFVEVLARH